jgi:Rne/Rng family ribonuclease
VVENGAVQEVHIERSLERGLVGNVYLGKVVRVLPGMQSAFVDIGLDRSAFLHVADLMSSVHSKHADPDTTSSPLLPIEKQVFEGQSILVQVIKDPLGSKGARLSAQISIAGRLLVFLPQDDHIGVSQKIALEQSRFCGKGFLHWRTEAKQQVVLFFVPMAKKPLTKSCPKTFLLKKNVGTHPYCQFYPVCQDHCYTKI